MKKKLLIISVALSASLVMGCGIASVQKTAEGTVKIEEETIPEPTAEPTPEPTAEPIPEPTPEPTAEPTPEPTPATWFDEKGLTITPQGDFTFQTMAVKGSSDLYEFDVTANVSITESTEGVEEGYKTVTAVFSENMGTEENFLYWHSAFDRYTGTSFEFDNTALYGNGVREGAIPIEYDGNTYDVSIEFSVEYNMPDAVHKLVITCPVDYEGTVFQCGYADRETEQANLEIDLSERLHTADEFPNFDGNGHKYYYFSADNK